MSRSLILSMIATVAINHFCYSQISTGSNTARRIYGGQSSAPVSLCTSAGHVGNVWVDKRNTAGTSKFYVCVNDDGLIGWAGAGGEPAIIEGSAYQYFSSDKTWRTLTAGSRIILDEQTGELSISVDDSEIPIWLYGSGAPSATCVAGQAFYLDTTAALTYFCSATDTWKALAVGPASAPTDSHVVLFDGTTGAKLKSGGKGVPSGDIVGTSDSQTLTGKTLTTPILTTYTVATLPGTPSAGQVVIVTDAATAGSCTSGSGSSLALCRYSGSAWVAVGDGTGSYDPLSSPVWIVEEWASSASTTPNVGSLGWAHAASSGATMTNAVAVEDGHPGMYIQTTGTSTSNAISSLHLTQAGSNYGTVHVSGYWDLTWIIKLGVSDSNTLVRIGLACTGVAGPTINPAEGIYFEKTAAGTKWYAVNRHSSTEDPVDTTVSTDTSWATLRIWRVDGSTVSFSINGTTRATKTDNMPTSGCSPWAGINNNSTNEAKTIIHDKMVLKVK